MFKSSRSHHYGSVTLTGKGIVLKTMSRRFIAVLVRVQSLPPYCSVVQIVEHTSHKGVGEGASPFRATICLCGEKVDTVPSKGAVLSGVLVQLRSQAPYFVVGLCITEY